MKPIYLLGAILLLLSVAVPLAAENQKEPLSGKLLYSRLTDGTWQVWVTDLSTGSKTQLTHSLGDKRSAAWVGDGAVTFDTTQEASFWLALDNRSLRPIFEPLRPIQDLAWSKDGRFAVFARFRTDIIDSANLWIVESNGNNPRLLTHEPGIQYQPAWAPDHSKIAYVAGHGIGTYELFVISPDGKDQQRLTTNESHEFLPAWSSDGEHIAFSSDASGNYEIWIMRSNGSALRQLTHSPGLDTRPAWSPDGRHLAFATNRSGKMEIWVMQPDGENARLLESAADGVIDPAWSK